MQVTQQEYEIALAEFQPFLSAPFPPPPGSSESLHFAAILEKIEMYEATLKDKKLSINDASRDITDYSVY
ncbi:hypothetical protein H9646_16695 [Comamonas sp. Sa2CVA6]|uniref:Uncharacterized protein n=1 Tax=Comamonas avium TaxID=2762231 RepID=A0ABR8SF46_9BURK|nr:hypothetical protein [Comamonas avium]